MIVELTEEQQQALDTLGETTRIVDPRTNAKYVLIREEDYQTVREALDEERTRKAIARIAIRNAAARMEEEP